MTRWRNMCSPLVTLAVLLVAPLSALANDKYFFSEGGYELTLDESVPANQTNLQPIGLTLGKEYLDNVDFDDILLRCSVFTGNKGKGRKGVKATLEGELLVGDDGESAGTTPRTSKNTKKNGYATFEFTADDISGLNPGPVDDFLLALMVAELDGNKDVDETDFSCSLGVPTACTANETTACLGGGRFQVKIFWLDPFDGSTRAARVESATRDSAHFNFFPLNSVEDTVVTLLDMCGGPPPSRGFFVEAEPLTGVDLTLTVVDTATGIVRHFGRGVLLNLAFETCP